MRLIVLLLVLAGLAFPQDKAVKDTPAAPPASSPAIAPTPHKISGEDQWHGKALDAQLSVLQEQFNSLQLRAQALGQERNALKEKVCGENKISVELCKEDFTAGTVTKTEPVKPTK